ncbi:MAG: hypothetical protein ACM3MB_10405 [Acidobacteriota bacterium]
MGSGRTSRVVVTIIALFVLGYLLLLIPERAEQVAGPPSSASAKQAFAWNQDAYWKALEAKYQELRRSGCKGTEAEIRVRMEGLQKLIARINGQELSHDAPEFGEIEQLMFETGPFVGACGTNVLEYIQFAEQMRAAVKRQSQHWDMTSDAVRVTLYRLLYGARSALEEIITQAPAGAVPALIQGANEPSVTPSGNIRNVIVHSGDILASRGGAPTSALIARGNDYPGNFSHIAFVYVDPDSKEAKIIEAHIEVGVVVSTVDQYLADKKLRVMLLRPRTDLPQLQKDPMLPHKAAGHSYRRATAGHILYDFDMDYKDHTKLFCSEVASEGYEHFGVHLWTGISHISSPGLRRWLTALGVKHFETQEPSDLEYDPQLRVVAEWRDPATLKKDRLDNAVTEVMLEGAEKGDELRYQRYLLPFARIVKSYCMVLNRFGKAGPIPEGMSATRALRSQEYMNRHEAIEKRLAAKTEEFRGLHGYEAPYWELVHMARQAKAETEGRGTDG